MIRPIDYNLLRQIQSERSTLWGNRPKAGPGAKLRQRQYDCWRSGVETSHSTTGGRPMGIERGAQAFVWPDKEKQS